MGKLLMYTVIFLAANVGLIFIFSFIVPLFMTNKDAGYGIDTAVAILVTTFIAFIIEIIVALFLVTNEKKKDIGKAMLLSVGIIFLVGLSLCSGIWS